MYTKQKRKAWNSGTIMSEEMKLRISKTLKDKHLKRLHSEETKYKISDRMSGRKQSESAIRNRVNSIIQNKSFAGRNNPMFGKTCRWYGKGNYYVSKDKKIWMRSSYELAFAKYLDENGLKWEYETKRFYFQNFTYTPDFYLPDYNLWIEIKGWMSDIASKKIEKFKELGNKIIVLGNLELKNLSII